MPPSDYATALHCVARNTELSSVMLSLSFLGIRLRVGATKLAWLAVSTVQIDSSQVRDVGTSTRTSCNPNGLLICDCVVVFAFDLDMVAMRRKFVYLKHHVLIAKFAIAPMPPINHNLWLHELKDRIGTRIALHTDKGGGFYFIKFDTLAIPLCVFFVTPYKLKVGMLIFQRWLPAFNPCQLANLVGLYTIGNPCRRWLV